jgi:hypothetical protein
LTQQLRNTRPQAVEIGSGSMFYLYRLSIKPTQGAERLPERRQEVFRFWLVLFMAAYENANASKLLRASRKWP